MDLTVKWSEHKEKHYLANKFNLNLIGLTLFPMGVFGVLIPYGGGAKMLPPIFLRKYKCHDDETW